ncbi:MAG: DUF3307 domain-containing protein [Flavobacteriales bacterium]
MNEVLTFFTPEEGNLLIRILLAHFAADFLFQTDRMVQNKSWVSKHMLLHIGIVFVLTALLSWSMWLALTITVVHWLIDGLKVSLKKIKNAAIPTDQKYADITLFIVDQTLHILTTVCIWSLFCGTFTGLIDSFLFPWNNYNCSLLLLAYFVVIWPTSYVVKYTLETLKSDKQSAHQEGGRLIGIFERIIILTLVLLGQYDAIGFLIAGKSIIRFASKKEEITSEYVLIGTMMSYAISILVGVSLNLLLA